ncbi:hypothetical protein HDV05_005559 [Chytridiales sp. JEL 0842]|nr:hypothetical protein HDV05_005559 [Chytridiales sp. JEL 0842]
MTRRVRETGPSSPADPQRPEKRVKPLTGSGEMEFRQSVRASTRSTRSKASDTATSPTTMSAEAITSWLLENPNAAAKIIDKVQTKLGTKDPKSTPSPPPSQQPNTRSPSNPTSSSPNRTTQGLRSTDTFFEIARTVYNSLELPDIIERVLTVAVTLIHAERCSVFLMDEEKGELYPTAFDVKPRDSTEVLLQHTPKPLTLEQKEHMETDEAYIPDSQSIYTPSADLPKSFSASTASFQSIPTADSTHTSTTAQPQLRLKLGTGIAGTVAQTGQGLNVNDAYTDPRFNASVDQKTGFKTRNILCLPIFGGPRTQNHPKGRVLGVASLINKFGPDGVVQQFSEEDVRTFKDFLVLVGIAIYNSMLYEKTKKKESEAQRATQKSKVLLDLAKALYSETETSQVCQKIITHARDLTNADQASCFLVDSVNGVLYSTVFNSGAAKEKVQFPMEKGIAGYVATSGQLVNLKNAYDDSRFNREMDAKTGYHTQSLLCTPIFGPHKNIVGVTYLINKLSPSGRVVPFTKDDENIFEAFSTFCGLALHKTLMMEEITKQRTQMEVTMELMSYHVVTHQEDLVRYNNSLRDIPTVPIEEIRKSTFNVHAYNPSDDTLVAIVCLMFEDLGYNTTFNISKEKAAQYTLTVRKNYRLNQYHNFTHAVSVVHGVYLLIQRGLLDGFGIDRVEAFAMFVACLNHDIDHRGTNNQFQKSASTALAQFYSTSTMERHHFNHAMTILRTTGHDIFSQLDSADYKRCLSCLEHAILATDLALYFKNRAATVELGKSKAYTPENNEHRALLRGIIMTCSDLSSMYKEWEDARHTAEAVYKEFFEQGDKERELGLAYSADLMDRENEKDIPRMQAGFFTHIVTPAFEGLECLMGNCVKFMTDGVRANEVKWKKLADLGVKYTFGMNTDEYFKDA